MKLKVYFENIDIKLLKKQKSFLLELAQSNEELMGIVHLIDEIQDQSADVSSEEEVFGNFCETCGSNNTERTNMSFDGDDYVPVIECQEEGCWHVKKIVTN